MHKMPQVGQGKPCRLIAYKPEKVLSLSLRLFYFMLKIYNQIIKINILGIREV